MTDDIHPNWQSTDGDGEPVLVRTSSSAPVKEPSAKLPRIQKPFKPISRQPAALAGILLSLGVGILVFATKGSVGSVGGTIFIHMTERGFSPVSVSAPVGSKITWLNEDGVSYMLQSDELCTENQECFSTTPIPPGASTSLIVTDGFAPGTFSYYAINVKNRMGTITVLPMTDRTWTRQQANLQGVLPIASGTGTVKTGSGSTPSLTSTGSSKVSSVSSMLPSAPVLPIPSSSSSLSPLSSSKSSAQSSSESSSLKPAASSISSSSAAASRKLKNIEDFLSGTEGASDAIPINPFTVGSEIREPIDNVTEDINIEDLKKAPARKTKETTTTTHSGAPLQEHRPLSQPQTGPAGWIAAALALGSFVLLTKSSLKRAVTR